MDKVDLKAERRDLYAPPRGRFVEVVVPRMTFLAVDGRGDPDTSEDYRHAVQALFTVSYAVKAVSRRVLGRDHVVLPLEGLWSATDWSAFERDARQDWSWTMMIRQPEWITDDLLERAREGVRDKHLPALPLLRSLPLDEGRASRRCTSAATTTRRRCCAPCTRSTCPSTGCGPPARTTRST